MRAAVGDYHLGELVTMMATLGRGLFRRPATLAARVRRRDPATWEQLVRDQHRRVFNLFMRLTGDREVAADLTQETFAAAFGSAHSYAGRSSPEAWLYGVGLNCLRNWRRRQGVDNPSDDPREELPDPSPTPEELAVLRQQADLIRDAVRRLPEDYQRAIALRYFAGVPAVEIARTEGVDPGTLRWRLHRGLQKLWVMLAPHLGKEELS